MKPARFPSLAILPLLLFAGFHCSTQEPVAPSVNPAPHPVFPPDRAIAEGEAPVRFSWTSVFYGKTPTYHFQIAQDTSFASPIGSDTLAEPARTLSRIDTGVYYWRVRIESDRGLSDWSAATKLIVPFARFFRDSFGLAGLNSAMAPVHDKLVAGRDRNLVIIDTALFRLDTELALSGNSSAELIDAVAHNPSGLVYTLLTDISIRVFDIANRIWVDTIALPAGTEQRWNDEHRTGFLALHPDSTRLFVLCGGTVNAMVSYAINAGPSYPALDTVRLGTEPQGIAFSPDGGTAYVGNARDYTVSVVNLSDGRVMRTFPVNGWPHTLAVASNGEMLLVSTSGGLFVFSTADFTLQNQFGESGFGQKRMLTPLFGDAGALMILGPNSGKVRLSLLDARTTAEIFRYEFPMGWSAAETGYSCFPDRGMLYVITKGRLFRFYNFPG